MSDHYVPLHWSCWGRDAQVACTCGVTFTEWDDAARHQLRHPPTVHRFFDDPTPTDTTDAEIRVWADKTIAEGRLSGTAAVGTVRVDSDLYDKIHGALDGLDGLDGNDEPASAFRDWADRYWNADVAAETERLHPGIRLDLFDLPLDRTAAYQHGDTRWLVVGDTWVGLDIPEEARSRRTIIAADPLPPPRAYSWSRDRHGTQGWNPYLLRSVPVPEGDPR